MSIECFDKIPIPGLKEKFQSRVKEGMSDKEQRELATEIAKEYHKELFDELNGLKKSLRLPQDKYEPFDNTKAVKEVNDKYDKLVGEEKAKTATEEVATPPPTEPPNNPPGPPAPKAEGETSDNGIGIKHASTGETRKEFGLPDYEGKPEEVKQWDEEAKERIKRGEVPALMDKMRKGDPIGHVEQRMLGFVHASLKEKVNKDPSDKNLQELHEFLQLADVVGGQIAGKSLRARQGLFEYDDTVASQMELERVINLDAPLTEQQKNTVAKETEAINDAQSKFDEKMKLLEEENAKLRADLEVKKQKAATPKTKKTHEDFVNERKDITAAIREKLRKARGDTNVVIVPYAKELIAIAPEIGQLVKNLVGDGVLKLGDIIDSIHETLKVDIPDINKKDINDLIAGEYNEKKKTRNKIAEEIFDLRLQAKAINRYEALLKGGEPKSEKDKIKRSQELEKLRKQIKDFNDEVKKFADEAKVEASRVEGEFKDQKAAEQKAEQEQKKAEQKKQFDEQREDSKNYDEGQRLQREKDNKDARKLSDEARKEAKRVEDEHNEQKAIDEKLQKAIDKNAVKLTGEQKALYEYKKRIAQKITNLHRDLQTGNFAPAEKKEPLKLDAEALKLKDELIALRQQREVRRQLAQRQSETGKEKAMRLSAEVLNIPRSLMTVGDFSGLLRQNLFFSVGHPLMTAKNVPDMFKSFGSQAVYDRWFADLKETPRYNAIMKSRLAIADSVNHDLSKREEALMSSLAEKIPIIGKTIVKGSERSYTLLLNKMRVDLFNYFADSMEKRGMTADNSPRQYRAMAEYINNATGRSDFGDNLNRVAPILNSVFFSPRLIASRVNMLTYWMQPRFWKTLPREARVDYFRNWISLLAVGGTILALAKLGGAEVEDDPRSSDFGKIKSGNTRWDIWAGSQQYMRVLAQVVSGQRKSTATDKMYSLSGDDAFGETKTGVITDFFRGKLAPVPAAAVDLLSGRTSVGDKVTYDWKWNGGDKEVPIPRYVMERLIPMTITGTIDAMKDQGVKALLTAGVPSTFGVGVNTYKPPASNGSTKPHKFPKPSKKPIKK